MRPRLTLGPIAYHWSAERRRDFYASIADEAPVDTVCLGEVICSKRAPFHEPDLPETIARLQRGGKTVVLSSLAEILLPRERTATAELCEVEHLEIEINNAAGLHARGRRPHRVGPFLNAYSERTIEWMVSKGATHICLPTELPGDAIGVAAETALRLGAEVEVQVFGRAPLAVSARCYHARAHGRHRDNCQFVCEADPDGMPLATIDRVPILRVNGIQTQSETYVCLLDEMPGLAEMEVSNFRLLPQDVDMARVATIFRHRLDGRIKSSEAFEHLAGICRDTRFSNGFFHRAPGIGMGARLTETAIR